MLPYESCQSMVQIEDPQILHFQPGDESIIYNNQHTSSVNPLQDKLVQTNDIRIDQNNSIYYEQEVNLQNNVEIQSLSLKENRIFQMVREQSLIDNQAQSCQIIPNKAKINQLQLENTSKKRQKNSNTIKKMGRIILDNLYQYYDLTKEHQNEGVARMLKALSKNSKVGRTQINKRDKFNTFHLRLLVDTPNPQLSNFNLKATRKILTKKLRENVLKSKQISTHNKLLYLNTLKCSSLRCVNNKLAVRLQMSD